MVWYSLNAVASGRRSRQIVGGERLPILIVDFVVYIYIYTLIFNIYIVPSLLRYAFCLPLNTIHHSITNSLQDAYEYSLSLLHLLINRGLAPLLNNSIFFLFFKKCGGF